MKTGIFYGVSVGPGDPELITLKALRMMERCPVICAPRTRDGRMLALEIAEQAVNLKGKHIVPLDFTMTWDKQEQHDAHLKAASLVEAQLAAGQDVAMLNLGDVSIYATFGYLRDILSQRGYDTAMVPGVPSFCAIGARLGVSLTAGEEPLHILPANAPGLEEALVQPGTKVLMKAGRQVTRLKQLLGESASRITLVRDCGLATEEVYQGLEEVPENPGYFATALVK